MNECLECHPPIEPAGRGRPGYTVAEWKTGRRLPPMTAPLWDAA